VVPDDDDVHRGTETDVHPVRQRGDDAGVAALRQVTEVVAAVLGCGAVPPQ
jgi:hypothetical protein